MHTSPIFTFLLILSIALLALVLRKFFYRRFFPKKNCGSCSYYFRVYIDTDNPMLCTHLQTKRNCTGFNTFDIFGMGAHPRAKQVNSIKVYTGIKFESFAKLLRQLPIKLRLGFLKKLFLFIESGCKNGDAIVLTVAEQLLSSRAVKNNLELSDYVRKFIESKRLVVEEE